jgi:predicted transposase YdaD
MLFNEHPRRNKIIRLLASWGVKIETGEIESFLGQEIIMGFSQAFLEWEEATEAKGIAIGEQRGISIGEQRGISIGEQRGISIGEQRGISIGQQEHARSLVIRLLARRIGILPAELRSKVEQLSVIQLDTLSEALLDFEQLADLTDWLDEHRQT